MPDNDFQERLQRIADKQPTGPVRTAKASPTGGGGFSLGRMIVSNIVIFIGAGLARFANENYETLKADGGVGLALGVGLGAVATLIYGVVLFFRSFRSRPAQAAYEPTPVRASGAARLWSSLVGLTFGIIAGVSMFMAAAARIVNPDIGNVFSGMALLTTLVLTLLAMLIGIVGLFRRGSALRRVPLYFVAGGILTFAAFRLLYIDLTTWPGFVALVQ